MARMNMFIERSLAGALTVCKESLSAEETARRNGLLQKVDARAKLAALAAVLLTAVWVRDMRPLLWLYAAVVAAAACSRLGLWFFLARTWFFIPLFTCVVVAPSLLAVVTPGEVVWGAGTWLAVTRQGAMGAALVVMRVATCVSASVLVALTTPHTRLLAALRSFGVPQVFVMVLAMTHRYLLVFAEELEHAALGMKSRIGTVLAPVRGRRIVAWNIATLWQRSMRMHQEVYAAMLSRGYGGEPRFLGGARMRAHDWLFIAAALLACAVVLTRRGW